MTSLSLFTFMHRRRKWQPTPVFLPGKSQGWGAWRAAVYGVAQSRTGLKRLSRSSSSDEESICQSRRYKRTGFNPLGQEDPLEKKMATQSSILALKNPRDRGTLAGYSAWVKANSRRKPEISSRRSPNLPRVAHNRCSIKATWMSGSGQLGLHGH